jgi:hypothetical protein
MPNSFLHVKHSLACWNVAGVNTGALILGCDVLLNLWIFIKNKTIIEKKNELTMADSI